MFLHDHLTDYAARLTATFPGDLSVAFLVNSGSEANDLALRLAHTHTGNKDVITLDHAYHGHLLSLIDISPYKFNSPGGRGCPANTHVAPVPDVYRGLHRDCDHQGEDLGHLYAGEVAAIIEKIKASGNKPSAFIAESLQSCGGQIIYPTNYLRAVYAAVRGAGGVVIADEVQVGFGRVGSHMWAFQTYGEDLVPDIVTLGKPMGNGHPIAAVVTTPAVAASFAATGIEYFNTYGGNPVSCAIGSAVLDVIERERLMERALQVGGALLEGAKQLAETHRLIGDVRGRGLFVGIDIVRDRKSRDPHPVAAEHVITRFKQEHVLLQSDGPHNNVLKFKPPLVFSSDNVKKVLQLLDTVLGEIEGQEEL